LETIKGTVSRIIFHSAESGFRVMKVKMTSGPTVSVTGEFGPEVIVGTEAAFHGDYKTHAKYGTNFKTTSYNISHNKEELDSIRLFIDHIAPNIGIGRSFLIIKHFGNEIIKVLDESPERLLEIDGIGKVSADSLVQAWRDNRGKWKELRQEYSLRVFLNNLGIKERRVKKILGHFGGGMIAEETIRANPYILTEIEGFGFSTADFAARQMGVPESEPLRLRSFILYTLNVLCASNGHLYLTRADIIQQITEYCKESNTHFIGKITLDIEDIEEPTKALVADNLIIIDGDLFYSKKNFNFEARSAEMLSNIIKAPSDLILLTRDIVDKHLATYEHEKQIILSEEQKSALYYFVEKKVFVITGCPGSGKTTLLEALVDLIRRHYLKLTCMTPTGISAKKMASTINYEAYTIHRRLGFKGNEWAYGEVNKFETDVVIIDESSMVDQEVFFRLLSALKNRVHIIFVGDDNQLPSVSAGNVLRELINCGQVPTIRLTQIFRQAEASDIIKVAHGIKNGDTDLSLFKPDPTADVFFLREKDPDVIKKIIIKLAQKFKDERRIFQIITPRNEGPLSVSELNTVLQATLNPPMEGLAEIRCYNHILRRGDRIIVRKNDYENSIFNGDIGKVVQIYGGFVYINIDNREIQLPVDELEEKIRLAYIISIHRCQGQEYPTIILPFINQFGKNMLQRNLLYTALTRAREKVIIIGHGSALEKAINNSIASRRNTKLGERIQSCLQLKKRLSFELPQEEPQTCPPAPLKEERSSPVTIESLLQGSIDDL
jgi:exodeoxyribonuclease V alpha subunit